MSRRGWALFTVMGVIWGLPYLLIKIADGGVSVPVLVFARVLTGTMLLLPVALRGGRLRGLRPYLWWVVAFAAVERPPQMIAALSAHFHDLDAKPLAGAPKDVVSAGKKLYEEGAGTDVPACGTCHGVDAKGNGPFPRLAGQLHDYTFNKLVNWSKERGQDPAKPDTSAIMEPITHGLSQQQVRAVAAYLNYLE